MKYELKDGKATDFIEQDNIVYLEACHGYTLFYMLSGQARKQSGHLGQHLKALQDSGLFFRTHRSYAVNTLHVKRIEPGQCAIMKNGEEVPLKSGLEHALRKAVLGL